ncbi:hypothetical protein F4818DRAFT_453212 [Hypoxylon cercidicola]|nr:hypothetical protein F4818DRAFT_453212 [Hypoxylon cercidicola]
MNFSVLSNMPKCLPEHWNPFRSNKAKRQPTLAGSPSRSECGDEKYGLFVLIDKPAEQEGGIDIVAVHGLGGNYIETWRGKDPASDQHYNWLSDVLPGEIPTARIMSFGYDSAVFSKSVVDIRGYASQLLEELLAKRSTVAEKKRPILFLCHNLGGIVFKKALIQAHECSQYEELLKGVKGVAFGGGTPLRGSEVANWTTLLGNLINVIPVSMRTTILKGLKRTSEELLGISQSFVDRGARLKITSFYESENLNGVNFVVCLLAVPASALLHLRYRMNTAFP